MPELRPLDGAFCATCGQKVRSRNPTLHDLLHDLTHELLHVDGKIFQSVRLLLMRPGFLTREYFEGRRARYISPIRLYLIFSVAYFAVAAVSPTTGFNLKITNDDINEIRKLGFETEEELQRAVTAQLTTWAPRLMFILVPLFAGLVTLVTRRSGRNYPQHLYFAFHLHAAAFALLAAATASRYLRPLGWTPEIIQGAALLWLLAYIVLAFRYAYGGTAARALLRAAVVSLIYLFVVLLTLIAMVLPLVDPRFNAQVS